MRSRVYVTLGCPSSDPSVCLFRRSTAAAMCGWFAGERGRVQQITTDSWYAALSSKCG